jgi:multidrug resistance efflux pump
MRGLEDNMVSENKGINVDKLAQALAADMIKLDKVASEMGALKDLKSIDFSSLLKGSTAETLTATAKQLRTKAEESAQQNEAKVAEISGQIEESIKTRQAELKRNLGELKKTGIDAETAALVTKRVDETIKNIDLRVQGLVLEKKTIAGDIRIKSVAADVTEKIITDIPETKTRG